MKKLIILGNGGLRKVIESSLNKNIYDIVAIIDNSYTEIDEEEKVYPTLDVALRFVEADYFFVAIGENKVRMRMTSECEAKGLIPISIIDTTALIAEDVKIGEGVYVGKRVIINPETTIGKSCIVNTSSIVEHSCEIGDFCNIAPRSLLLGFVSLGNRVFIGAATHIKQTVSISDGIYVGMNSLVLKDIKEKDVMYYGSPAKKPKVKVVGVSKAYSVKGLKYFKKSEPALKDINLDLEVGKIYGFVGTNGTGKTTLLRLLNSSLEPTTGFVDTQGTVILLNIGGSINSNMSAYQNIKSKSFLYGQEFNEDDVQKVLEYAELTDYRDAQVSTFSNGMRARLGFAISIHLDFDILLIDETFAVGDAKFSKKCLATLMKIKENKIIVLCSHSQGIISICDEVVNL